MTRPTTSTPRPAPPSHPRAGELPDRLQRLEDESIHIIREVSAQFSNPVMLYSIGKDSSVMLHLARKAFHPGPIPFPLLHIDTTWKFSEMIAFRDRMAAEIGFELVVHTNPDGLAAQDGENMRLGVSKDLGFSPADRAENIRRAGEVSALLRDAGAVVLAAFISPYRSDRDRVRGLHPEGAFLEVFVDAPVEVCEQRDPKGLYAKARSGAVAEVTGVNAPYEPPEAAELHIDTAATDVGRAAAQVLGEVLERIRPPACGTQDVEH